MASLGWMVIDIRAKKVAAKASAVVRLKVEQASPQVVTLCDGLFARGRMRVVAEERLGGKGGRKMGRGCGGGGEKGAAAGVE